MGNKKKEASINTQSSLLKIAREKFSKYGFADTPLEKIAEESGMTRGAVYHHYKNKKELFLAVLNQIHYEIGESVEQKALLSDNEWNQLVLGSIEFVKCATLPEYSRILLIDAPNTIGWKEWKTGDRMYSQSRLEEQLEILQSKGKLVGGNVKLISAMISGALNELAITLSESGSYYEEELNVSISNLLNGFKNNG